MKYTVVLLVAGWYLVLIAKGGSISLLVGPTEVKSRFLKVHFVVDLMFLWVYMAVTRIRMAFLAR